MKRIKSFSRIIFVVALILVVGAFFTGCKKSESTIKIGGIFSITGPSFLGVPESNTAKMLVEKINAAGGIDGKKIELIIEDDGGKPEQTLALAQKLIEEEKVIAIIGPSTSGATLKIKQFCEENKTILMSCAAAEKIVNPVAKYVFKTPQKDSFVVNWIFKTMQEMGINKIAILTSNTGFGLAGADQLKKFAPDYNIDVVISETYDKATTDLTAILTKVKGKNVDAVVNWSIVPAQSIIAVNMKQLKMNIPLFQSHGFGNIKFVKNAGDAANGIIFPCGRLLIADQLDDTNPQKEALVEYKNEYESKYNEDVSTFGGHAYDALMILVEALKKAGTDEEKLRDAIEQTQGFAGTGGVFSFSPEDHNGLDMSSLEMLTVVDGKFAKFEKK